MPPFRQPQQPHRVPGGVPVGSVVTAARQVPGPHTSRDLDSGSVATQCDPQDAACGRGPAAVYEGSGEGEPDAGSGCGVAAHDGGQHRARHLVESAADGTWNAGAGRGVVWPSPPQPAGEVSTSTTPVGAYTSRFIAQHRRPDWLHDAVFETLSAYHRLLLINDGLTVPLIEAMTLERTRVRCIRHQTPGVADPFVGWLHPTAAESAVCRQVVIEGCRSRVRYVHARSVFIASRLPVPCTDLDVGIGAALHAAKTETRRELLWWGRGEGVASRLYRIVINAAPVFVVYEDFLR